MGKINAVITGVGGYVPDYVLTNEELSRMVDTNDEWITTRVGIKERRILKEEGLGSSYMGRKAAKQLMQKTGVDPVSYTHLSKKHTVAKGLITLHQLDGKVYFEMPISLLGKDMLIGSTVTSVSDNGNAIVGSKPTEPLLVRLSLIHI